MKRMLRGDTLLGIASLLIALLLLLVVIPLDTDTGLLEKVRRRWEIGDAMAPAFAAVLLGVAGLSLLFKSHTQTALTDAQPRQHVLYVVKLLLLLLMMSLVMRWLAPILVSLLLGGEYRPLRDTLPWKYLGFAAGGFILIFCCICAVEKKLSWRAFIVAVLVPLALALFYDLPFDDLLLPPNGDV